MDEPRPIDRYGRCIAKLQSLSELFKPWSESWPLRHQLIRWLGPDKPSNTVLKEFLLEVGVLPFEAKTPGEHVRFVFLDPSRWAGFRWQEGVDIPVPTRISQHIPAQMHPFIGKDVLRCFEELAPAAVFAVSDMHAVHEWLLPGRASRVPMAFRHPINPPFPDMTHLWLESLYDAASEWPVMPDAPSWMPKTSELKGKNGRATLIESQDVWMLSGEAISRWLPPDVDDFLSDWKETAAASRAARVEARPQWDARTRMLTYQGNVIKRFKQPAENQTALLDLLETARWSGPVSEPEFWQKHHNTKRLGDTLYELNKDHVTKDQMHFAAVGTTMFTWHSGPKNRCETCKRAQPSSP